jgi:hypothetical protein
MVLVPAAPKRTTGLRSVHGDHSGRKIAVGVLHVDLETDQMQGLMTLRFGIVSAFDR